MEECWFVRAQAGERPEHYRRHFRTRFWPCSALASTLSPMPTSARCSGAPPSDACSGRRRFGSLAPTPGVTSSLLALDAKGLVSVGPTLSIAGQLEFILKHALV